jgi:hypothetical protein
VGVELTAPALSAVEVGGDELSAYVGAGVLVGVGDAVGLGVSVAVDSGVAVGCRALVDLGVAFGGGV